MLLKSNKIGQNSQLIYEAYNFEYFYTAVETYYLFMEKKRYRLTGRQNGKCFEDRNYTCKIPNFKKRLL